MGERTEKKSLSISGIGGIGRTEKGREGRKGGEERTFVGVVKVHGVEADGGDGVWDDVHGVVASTLEDLVGREGDEFAPNTIEKR